MSLAPLQTSHPKSSRNKGLGKRPKRLKTLHWKFLQDVYSRLLFRKEVALSALYLMRSRTVRAQGVSPDGKRCCPNLTQEPCKDKSASRNRAPQAEPTPDQGQGICTHLVLSRERSWFNSGSWAGRQDPSAAAAPPESFVPQKQAHSL